ncbi:hypothetical protein GCM10010320_11640 [Streptomyces caelestis]|nr:hypothetical protein GCM10010320_11640 [Streptomyces caelestis]
MPVREPPPNGVTRLTDQDHARRCKSPAKNTIQNTSRAPGRTPRLGAGVYVTTASGQASARRDRDSRSSVFAVRFQRSFTAVHSMT